MIDMLSTGVPNKNKKENLNVVLRYHMKLYTCFITNLGSAVFCYSGILYGLRVR